jgi:hypothetical protein
MAVFLLKGVPYMNKDLQLLAAGRGVRQWQIAQEIGVASETLCRWMRCKLSRDKRELVLAAIDKLAKEVTTN